MAILTKVEEADAARLAHEFGVVASGWAAIEAGSVNTNGRVSSFDGKAYFLRVYEEQTDVTARHEAALLAALAGAGVPTPIPLPRVDGAGFIATFRTKPVALFPFLPGRIACQKSVTEARTRRVGAALAQVHDAGEAILAGPLGARIGEGRFGRAALRERLAGLVRSELSPDVASARVHLDAALAAPAPGDRGEAGFIHGDLFRDNVLWSDRDEPTLLDFESASRGPIAFDLAVTMLAWCFGDGLDASLAAALMDGYRSVRRVAPSTRNALFGESLFACWRFATTRITDFELRPPGSGVYKDFRRWLARESALRALGAAGLEAMLFGRA